MTTATKIQIKPTWNEAQLREVTSHVLVNNYIAITKMFAKVSPELRLEFRTMMAGMKANYYKSLNVKTPMELAKAMAEFEANVFGSDIVISGDDNKAEIEYVTCGCWNLMQKNSCFTAEIGEQLGECFSVSTDLIAKELGFKGNVVMSEKSAVITFTK
jgi:hypothetical protein